MYCCSLGTKWLLLSGLYILVMGCQGPSNDSDLAKSLGRLNLAITDAPVDFAANVYVQFSGIEVKGSTQVIALYFCEDPANSSMTVVSPSVCTKSKPASIDLLALHSGNSAALLSAYPLNAGHYESIRLMVDAVTGVDDSYVILKTDTSKYELEIPSGEETGLKLTRGFDVAAGGRIDLTIDFDLRKSVREATSSVFTLRPALRIVDNLSIGGIVGSVNTSLISEPCSPAVYVYSGSNITPDDVGSTNGPLTTAVVSNLVVGSYAYRAAFLEAGRYTVAFTCGAASDDPGVDGELIFLKTANITVAAQTETIHVFE